MPTDAFNRRHHGVYAVGHTASAELAQQTEALLACPEGAVLSHHSAASLWKLRPEPDAREPVHVTIPHGTDVRKPGIRAHRTRSLHRADIHKGLPVTSPARTHIDIAPLLTSDELEQALDDALNHNLLRESQLGDALARAGHGRPGTRLLRRLLENRDSGGSSRSHPERTLRGLIIAAQLPHFEMNAQILGFTVDFAWPQLKVIVEDDGWLFHSSRAKFESDRRRDAVLEAHGWTVIRVTARQLAQEPYAVIARLAAALALAEARLAA